MGLTRLASRSVWRTAFLWGLWLALMSARADGLQSFQDFLQHSRSGQAAFVQKVTAPARAGQAPRVKVSSGRLAYVRPERFRIDYEKPDAQTLLGDGRQFWFVDADLQQVTVRDQKSVLSSAPVALILTATQLDALRVSFDLKNLPDADGLSWVEINPKSTEGTLRQLRVGLKGQGSQARVAVLEFADGFGQTSRLELSAIESPAALPSQMFELKPPAGYQVLRP